MIMRVVEVRRTGLVEFVQGLYLSVEDAIRGVGARGWDLPTTQHEWVERDVVFVIIVDDGGYDGPLPAHIHTTLEGARTHVAGMVIEDRMSVERIHAERMARHTPGDWEYSIEYKSVPTIQVWELLP